MDYTTLQAAVNAAEAGWVLELTSGATYTESITLPSTLHNPPVTIRSSAAPPNRRVVTSDAANMATITSGHMAEPAITGDGVRGWTFQYVRFYRSSVIYYYILLTNHNNGDGTFRNTDRITFDRCLIQGGLSDGPRIGLRPDGSNITIDRCCIENIRSVGAESKAILVVDGPGPFTITDNYLEAASINVLFGGANSSSINHRISNVEFANNHCFKRLSWINTGVAAKNNFEIKQGVNFNVHDNVLENNWWDAQDGSGFLFQAFNDEGGSPWHIIQNVHFHHNTILNVERACSLNGHDFIAGNDTLGMFDIIIEHNLFRLVQRGIVSNNYTGWVANWGGEIDSLIFRHNTIFNPGRIGWLTEGQIAIPGGGTRPGEFAIRQLTFVNNLLRMDGGGLGSDGMAGGTPTLDAVVTTRTWTHNVLAGGPGGETYPGTVWYPSVATHLAEFNADGTLTVGSTYENAGSDGLDLGWIAEGVSVPPPTILTTTLPQGTVGAAYTTTLLASGGVLPYTWTATVPSQLPPGLTLSTAGVLSGTPTTANTYNWTAQVEDDDATTDTQALSVTINAVSVDDGRSVSATIGGVTVQSSTFLSSTAPTTGVRIGDHWENTSTSPPRTYKATAGSPTPTWAVANPIPMSMTYKADSSASTTSAGGIQGTAVEEVDSNGSYRLVADLTNVTEMALNVRMGAAGGTTSRAVVQYSTNIASPLWTSSEVLIGLPGAGITANSGWVTVPAGMRGLVLLRVVVTNGNGTEAPTLRAIRMLAR